MPLTRYQLRNEYSLADPELYRAADKDDPEALLEGVAMAGLVGVLRQLGDLAEFAAEIFHDLHEEVMATAARGHGLMVRVQQLEAEVPSIEKAFLSQTNHSLFFSSTGVEWHPNLRAEQNLMTRGDLPRFVMDSYEECRGPPRLFLLDKFDVAGAGACLKRYTDPSFFKVEVASCGIAAMEVQREKKNRKIKQKKGSRWRNGETPDMALSSHAKLQQLFLEERLENAYADPSRLVKLKRRQLNGSPLDSKSGKGYMEKLLESPSPERKLVCEASVIPPPLKLTSDNSSESGLEIVDISTVSPANKRLPEMERTNLSPNARAISKASMDKLNGEVNYDRGTVKVPESTAAVKTNKNLSNLHKVMVEKELFVEVEGSTDGNVNGNHSDDMTSEVDNYVDALATMESETETDNESRPKSVPDDLNIGKHETDSEANEEQLEVQAHFSDSLSIGYSSVSDDGSSLFKKGRSSLSYSDTHSSLAENGSSDGGAIKSFLPDEVHVAEIVDMPFNQPTAYAESLKTESLAHTVHICEDEMNGSCVTDQNPRPSPSDLGACSEADSLAGSKVDESPFGCIKFGSEFSSTDRNESNLVGSSEVVSRMNGNQPASFESHPVKELDNEQPNVLSDAFSHSSNMSELATEEKSSYNTVDKFLQTNEAAESSAVGAPNLPTEQRFPSASIAKAESSSVAMLVPDNSDVVKSDNVVYEVDNHSKNGVNSENVTPVVGTSQIHGLDKIDNVAPVELDLSEIPCSEDKEDLDEVSSKEKGVDTGEADSSACEFLSNHSDNSKNHECLDDIVTETVRAEDADLSTNAVDPDIDVNNDISCHSLDLIGSPSRNLGISGESIPGDECPHQTGLALNEASSPECLIESETQQGINQLEVGRTDLDSKPFDSISYQCFNSENAKDNHDSSPPEHSHISLPDTDVTTASPSSRLSVLESESIFPNQSCLSGNNKETISSGTCQLQESGTPSEADQLVEEYHQPREPSFELLNLQSEQLQSLYHMDQERSFNSFSEFCPQVLPSQLLASEILPKSVGEELDATIKQTMNPLDSGAPSFGQLTEGTQVSVEEMPPLPPLPPMQWRTGKIQHFPFASQTELVEHGQISRPLSPPSQANGKAEFGYPAPQSGIFQPAETVLPIATVQHDGSWYFSEQLGGNQMLPMPSSLQLPSMVNDPDCQNKSLGTSPNPFIALPALSNETSDHRPVVFEGKIAQRNTNPFLSEPSAEYIAVALEPSSSQEKPIQTLNQLAPETGLESKICQNTAQNSEGEQREEKVPPQHVFSISEGETAWPSYVFAPLPEHEGGRSNGNASIKLPRPRSPLIEAVAAHDKSKLRKVSERVRPQTETKVDERGSLLEQIRTKSFNLKPATATRPSIQGPKTNLKLAAILEKANAIRQAFAGSDEDDDDDSWSDS